MSCLNQSHQIYEFEARRAHVTGRRVRETDKMKLTDREQAMLDGAEGAGAALAMEILAGIGEVMEADVMVPVSRAHVSASAQEADLWFA